MSVKIKEKDGNFILVYDVDGKRKQEKIKGYQLLPVKGDAEQKRKIKEINKKTLSEVEKIRLQKEYDLTNQKLNPERLKFFDYWETVRRRRSATLKLALSTELSWNYAKKFCMQYFDKEILLDDITVGILEDFKVWMTNAKNLNKDTKIVATSANCIFAKVRCVLDTADAEGLLKHKLKSVRLRFKEDEKKPVQYLTEEELDRFAEVSVKPRHQDLKIAFLCASYSGLRYSDVCSLKWSNIVDGCINLTAKKTHKKTIIPISKKLEKYLNLARELNPTSDVVFPNLRKYRGGAGNYLTQFACQAGIQKVLHFHMSRDSFACNLLAKGANVYSISQCLSHSSISTTEKHYLSADISLIRQATDLFDK